MLYKITGQNLILRFFNWKVSIWVLVTTKQKSQKIPVGEMPFFATFVPYACHHMGKNRKTQLLAIYKLWVSIPILFMTGNRLGWVSEHHNFSLCHFWPFYTIFDGKNRSIF